MSFPKPPFKLNDEGKVDQVLLKYLKEADNFSFLSPEAIEKINQLEIGEEENMLKVRDDLFELWPIVLTDALRELKRNDPREWEDPADEKTATFFDSTSLGVAELKDVFAGFSDFAEPRFHCAHRLLVQSGDRAAPPATRVSPSGILFFFCYNP